jgi:hypothetical protein
VSPLVEHIAHRRAGGGLRPQHALTAQKAEPHLGAHARGPSKALSSVILRTQPNVTINAIGSPMKVIQAFGPEITGGSPISPEDVLSSEIKTGAKGRPYYVYDLKVRRP